MLRVIVEAVYEMATFLRFSKALEEHFEEEV